MRYVVMVILVAIIVYAVGQAVVEMPAYGRINPTFNYVYDYYLSYGVEQTGATNVVTQVLADYRAYDTLIETVVLFASIVASILVLRTPFVDG